MSTDTTDVSDARKGRTVRIGHCRQDEIDVYIGRGQNGRHLLSVGTVGARGWLGNPYTVDEYGRKRCIEKYRVAFEDKIERDSEFRDAVKNLAGKTLGCWCRSIHEDEPACHGDVIAEWVDKLGANNE